jgi:xanthine dehydrogenase accessory factor
MNDWIDNLAELLDRDETCVLLTVAGVRGSAPREVGAKMIVTAKETIGTIGGGQLEYKCAQIAVEKIHDSGDTDTYLRHFPLGVNCGQCCGGVVDVMFERISRDNSAWLRQLQISHNDRQPVVLASFLDEIDRKFLIDASGCMLAVDGTTCPTNVLQQAQLLLSTSDNAVREDGYLFEPVRQSEFHVAVFGAGHVGAATVDVLSRLDCSIRWVDGRKNIFPERVPDNVTAIESTDLAREVAAMPAKTYYLTMTHSHPLDLEICARILGREDAAYCGLIGSGPKRRRFERLLAKQGIADNVLQRLTCPIGIAGIEGKKPAEIAVAVAAEILQTRESSRARVDISDKVLTNVHVI